MKKKIVVFLAGFLICLQAIRPATNSGVADTPKDITHYVHVPPQIMTILKRSCYDCHSNHTRYPWYSRITPVNFWLHSHVEEGKKVFNFSDFSRYSRPRLASMLLLIGHETAARTVPLPSYLWIHKEAILSDREIQEVVLWTRQEAERLTSSEANAVIPASESNVRTIKPVVK